MAYKTVKEITLDCDLDKLLNEFFCYFRDSKEKQPTESDREQFKAIIDDIKKITPLNKAEVIHAEIWDPYSDEQGAESRTSINDNGFDLRTLDVYINVLDDPFPNSFKCCNVAIYEGELPEDEKLIGQVSEYIKKHEGAAEVIDEMDSRLADLEEGLTRLVENDITLEEMKRILSEAKEEYGVRL